MAIEEKKFSNADESFLMKIDQIIAAEISSPDFGVDRIVELMLMSRSALYVRFKELTGKSIGNHINDYRLMRAKDMLRHKAMSISEIAEALGFRSQRYFSTFFKRPLRCDAKCLPNIGIQDNRRRIEMNAINPFARPLYVMAKPAGAMCNMACTYCYYLEKKELYADDPKMVMSDSMLELYTKRYLEAQTMGIVNFTWHGGRGAHAAAVIL